MAGADEIAAALFASSTEVALLIDAGGAVVRASHSTASVLGLRPDEALGDRLWSRCGPGQASRELCARAARGEVGLDALPRDDALLAADGTPRWVTWRWARAGDLLLGLARDVTAERRVGDARRKAEERFELAARASRDLIYDWDVVSDRIAWGNCEESLGLTPEELGSTVAGWEARIHPDDLGRVRAKIVEAIDRGTTYEDEYRFLVGGGAWATVRDRGLVVQGPDGRAVRMIGNMEDVTEERRAHEELAASEARYRFIAETTSDVVYDYDARSDRFVSISPRVEEWLGVPAARLCAEPGLWWALMEASDAERVRRSFSAQVAAGRQRVRYEYRIRRADGAWRTVHDVCVITLDARGEVARARGTVSDVGELRTLQAGLAQAQKLESVGRLAGGIAHDFNNLLTGMLGNLGLARLRLDDADQASAHLVEVERAIDRAAGLVRGLLAYSRRSPLALEPVDLRECVASVVRLLRPALGPGIEVVVRAPPDLPRAQADAARVEQTLMNLALNARDAMPRGGALRFVLDGVEATPPSAENGGEPGRYVRVAVEDTGVGMTPEVRARAFEPFFTTKAERGTGLGLAVVLGIVTQHSGWVDCESQPGAGSRFVIHLPQAASSDRAAAAAAPTPGAPAGRETVLVADDEPAIRRAVRAMLEGFGFAVVTARDGQEAVDEFAAARDRIRAVVLDMTMPRLGGREAMAAIRQLDGAVPIVITTGYAIDDLAALPGVTAALAKPYHPTDLARTLRRLIDARALT